MTPAEETLYTEDALFDGRLLVRQPRGGYRFSIDAVLLAGLTRVKAADRAVDLGTGCGVVPLVMVFRGRGRHWLGVEIQPELAALAAANVELNGYASQIEIIRADYREIAAAGRPQSFDLAVSNPPYRRLDTGRVNPDWQRAVARHEISGRAADVFVAARYLLVEGGRLAVIYPPARLAALMVAAHEHGFGAKRLILIHSREGGPARLAHLECVKGGGEELSVEPPFFIYDQRGSYTERMQELYSP